MVLALLLVLFEYAGYPQANCLLETAQTMSSELFVDEMGQLYPLSMCADAVSIFSEYANTFYTNKHIFVVTKEVQNA